MTERVTVNRDRSAILPDHSPQKGYRITREEAVELGLLDSSDKPTQTRRTESAPAHAEKVGPTAKAPQKRRTRKKA